MKAYKHNMKDQSLTKDRHILHCVNCDSEASGNRGDYFNYPENHLFHCSVCGEEMELVNKRITVEYTD